MKSKKPHQTTPARPAKTPSAPVETASAARLSDLRPDPRNANKGTERGAQMLEDSLRAYGAGRSLLVDKHGVVIAGNKTLEAAAAIGLSDVIRVRTDGRQLVVVERTDLDLAHDPRAMALAVADNRVAQIGLAWDADTLQELTANGADLSRLFTDKELAELVARQGGTTAGLTDPDDVPPERPTDIKLGDLFALGDHRLLCGDSTKAEDVARVMDGARAGLMNTDPPYGVSYTNNERPNPGVAKPRVANDTLADEALQAFLESVFGAAKDLALLPDAAWYLWHAHLTQGFFAAAAAAAKVVLHRQIIWVKPVLLLGRGQYHWKHEPCFMGWVQGQQPPDYGRGNGERDQTTVWEISGVSQAERKELNHSTPKPVELFSIPIVKHLRAGEVCFEPFAGSGPQIIAAEQCGVSCRAIEIHPPFVQTIIDRWEAFTGRKAERIS